jgi:hypothetical protein
MGDPDPGTAMYNSFRQRFSRAVGAGLMGAGVTVAAQYFIGVPVGRQPEWLGAVASTTALPAQYVLFPFSGLVHKLVGPSAGNGVLLETVTPFGPAMRFDMSDLALVALATVIIVGLADYAAQGVTELWEKRKQRWPILN